MFRRKIFGLQTELRKNLFHGNARAVETNPVPHRSAACLHRSLAHRPVARWPQLRATGSINELQKADHGCNLRSGRVRSVRERVVYLRLLPYIYFTRLTRFGSAGARSRCAEEVDDYSQSGICESLTLPRAILKSRELSMYSRPRVSVPQKWGPRMTPVIAVFDNAELHRTEQSCVPNTERTF